MDRRSFLLGAGASVIGCKPSLAAMDGWSPKRAYVSHPSIVMQQCMMWCWAAAASMIFAANGHPTDQLQIVNRVFGGTV